MVFDNCNFLKHVRFVLSAKDRLMAVLPQGSNHSLGKIVENWAVRCQCWWSVARDSEALVWKHAWAAFFMLVHCSLQMNQEPLPRAPGFKRSIKYNKQKGLFETAGGYGSFTVTHPNSAHVRQRGTIPFRLMSSFSCVWGPIYTHFGSIFGQLTAWLEMKGVNPRRRFVPDMNEAHAQ